MRPRSPHLPPLPRPDSRAGRGARVRVGPWRAPRRFLPVALLPVMVYMALWALVGYSLGAAGCRGDRPATLLLGARPGAGSAGNVGSAAGGSGAQGAPGTPGAAGGLGTPGAAEVLVESDQFALPAFPGTSASFGVTPATRASASSGTSAPLGATPATGASLSPGASASSRASAALGAPGAPGAAAGNRFDAGWEPRTIRGRGALVPVSGSGRLEVVNLGEEVPRTLTLDLVREGLPEGQRLSVRTGERELARATLHAAALPLQVRLPEDLPVGLVPLDLVFGPAAGGSEGGGNAAGRPGPPALYGAGLAPALPAGVARVEGADLVMAGNCLAYLRCQLAGREALVGTFVPPAAARPGQRFELSVERPDGTPIRRYGWRPSFWNGLRGARSFELPLRGSRGPVRVRLISRAGAAGGPPGRWQALGLVDVTGEILTPGQGQ